MHAAAPETMCNMSQCVALSGGGFEPMDSVSKHNIHNLIYKIGQSGAKYVAKFEKDIEFTLEHGIKLPNVKELIICP